MNRLNPIFTNVIASFFIWVTMGLVALIASDNDAIMKIGMLASLGTCLILWMVWGLNQIEDDKTHAADEKAKRAQANENPNSRLALLLELMDDGERQQLKQRLIEEMQSNDGESVALADLLAAQNSRSHH
ncbi:MAG TPA: hypothetical protein VHP83_16990 [Aggregatilineaceae bacterium]|nr:hypothetical protein [Aggregatilineaceae bacterium]